jgi:cytosine/adenosine deaminase-related metal-dependent hydrolase
MRIWSAPLVLLASLSVLASPEPAPERVRGEGPFQRLVLRGVTIVNGEGAPPVGPMDVLIEGNRIAEIRNLGLLFPTPPGKRIPIEEGDRVLELGGHYLLPGFVDLHAHFGGEEQGVPAEYVAKLWLAHGITTVREPGSGNGLDWVLEHSERSEENRIAAPRIVPYVFFGQGEDGPFLNTGDARAWVRRVHRRGARGVKFFGAPREIMAAALEEVKELGMGAAMHHAQLDVVNWNVLDSARAGMTTMEHWYGLPEAMFEDQRVQDYPLDYNYNNEQHRFGQAGRLWKQAARPGS